MRPRAGLRKKRRGGVPRLARKTELGDGIDHQLEKSFANDDLVAVFDIDRRARREPLPPVYIGAVKAADVFNGNLTILDAAEGMLT